MKITRLWIILWDLGGLEVIFNPATLVRHGTQRCWDLISLVRLVRLTSGDDRYKLQGPQCISAQRQGYASTKTEAGMMAKLTVVAAVERKTEVATSRTLLVLAATKLQI